LGSRRGHVAAVVGNEKQGWHYVSFSTGDTSVSALDNVDYRRFENLSDLVKSPALKRYTKFIWYFTIDQKRNDKFKLEDPNDTRILYSTEWAIEYIKQLVKDPPSYHVGYRNCLTISGVAVSYAGGQVSEVEDDERGFGTKVGYPPSHTNPNTHLKWVLEFAKNNPKKAVAGDWPKDIFTVEVPPPRDEWIRNIKK
jgi:hypothetical protein